MRGIHHAQRVIITTQLQQILLHHFHATAKLEYTPLAENKRVRVDADAFEEALTRLVPSARYDQATPEEFEDFLRKLYSRPEMRARFPNGF